MGVKVSASPWFDPLVGASAWDALLRQVQQRKRRVLLWGPPGVGRGTLLRRLAEETRARVHNAPSFAEATALLVRAPAGEVTVLSTTARAGLFREAP